MNHKDNVVVIDFSVWGKLGRKFKKVKKAVNDWRYNDYPTELIKRGKMGNYFGITTIALNIVIWVFAPLPFPVLMVMLPLIWCSLLSAILISFHYGLPREHRIMGKTRIKQRKRTKESQNGA